ncbi:hypothetical protein H312_02055, partial [Anncaliia algerae PRA339]
RILEKKNIDYLYLDGSDKENFELVSEVTQEYKQTTFPLIFLDGEFVGGCSDLESRSL